MNAKSKKMKRLLMIIICLVLGMGWSGIFFILVR